MDRLSRVQDQVNAVTETMQDNVQQMLANVDRADQLVDDTGARGCHPPPVTLLTHSGAQQTWRTRQTSSRRTPGASRAPCGAASSRCAPRLPSQPRGLTRGPRPGPLLQMNLLIIFIFLAIVGTIALIVVLSNQ